MNRTETLTAVKLLPQASGSAYSVFWFDAISMYVMQGPGTPVLLANLPFVVGFNLVENPPGRFFIAAVQDIRKESFVLHYMTNRESISYLRYSDDDFFCSIGVCKHVKFNSQSYTDGTKHRNHQQYSPCGDL